MDKKEIIAVLLKRIDVKGLIVEDLVDGALNKALDKVVNDSSNTFDNMAKDALWPYLRKAVVEGLDELLAKAQA